MITTKRVNNQTISVHYFISQPVRLIIVVIINNMKVKIETIRMPKMLYLTNNLIKKMFYCFESWKLILCMPTVYIKQLKQYTKLGIRENGEGNYTVQCVNYHLKNLALINLLTLHTHFKYVLTNFVT